ncbi:hypothetical protein DUI87_16070 [Hirundo rustica rustica]|uniref:Uncharacterized protein n=1 Tax=Hirundo rustica rustica TaxID=333673 RepID=A0A3M0K086_HIRRU|nr:hypothetical protein DUI87_16070 [Hirundo rustica rustica]
MTMVPNTENFQAIRKQHTILEDASLYTPPSNSIALQCPALLTNLVGSDQEVMGVHVRSERSRVAMVFMRVILAVLSNFRGLGTTDLEAGYELKVALESGAAYEVG